jgi:hypothetical protein
MTSDAVRWVRALTLASVLFTTGLVGHAAAEGFLPAVSVLIPLFLLTVVAVGPFVGAPLTPARTVALLLGGQALLHAALQLLGRSALQGLTTQALGAAGFSTSSSAAGCPRMADGQERDPRPHSCDGGRLFTASCCPLPAVCNAWLDVDGRQ